MTRRHLSLRGVWTPSRLILAMLPALGLCISGGGCGGGRESAPAFLGRWRLVVTDAIEEARRGASRAAISPGGRTRLNNGLDEFERAGTLDFEIDIESRGRATFQYLTHGQSLVVGSWTIRDDRTLIASFKGFEGASAHSVVIVEPIGSRLWLRVNHDAIVPLRRVK